MAEILTVGEPLVVFASQDQERSLSEAQHFQKFPAGAELNFAIGAARLGHHVSYLSQVGNDPWGNFILDFLQKNNVQTSYIQQTEKYATGIEFKSKTSHGDPETFYLRRDSAASHLDTTALTQLNYADIGLAHLTGIFPALSRSSHELMTELVANLQDRHIPISFDPNIRPALWHSSQDMERTLNYFAKQATIFLPGSNEIKMLSNQETIFKSCESYFEQSRFLKLIVIKDGSHGAYFQTRDGRHELIPSFNVMKVIDTVGAGDGFALGLLSSLLDGRTIHEAIIRANAIGALAVQSPGDNDGYPDAEQLESFIRNRSQLSKDS